MSNSPEGYCEIKGIEKYNGISIRNVRVVRVDLLKYLEDCFSEELIDKYRQVLYYIIAGYGVPKNTELIKESLETIYKEDETFRLFMGKIVYFRDSDLEQFSIYKSLLEKVKRSIDECKKSVTDNVPYVKVICDSHLYLYLSVSDTLSNEELSKYRGLEVISI